MIQSLWRAIGLYLFGQIDNFIYIQQDVRIIGLGIFAVSDTFAPPEIPLKLIAVKLDILRNIRKIVHMGTRVTLALKIPLG